MILYVSPTPVDEKSGPYFCNDLMGRRSIIVLAAFLLPICPSGGGSDRFL
jgi:hypothetical protein